MKPTKTLAERRKESVAPQRIIGPCCPLSKGQQLAAGSTESPPEVFSATNCTKLALTNRHRKELAVEASIEGTVKMLLISGGTGTGETTLLRIFANSIAENERILVSEDTPELQIRKPNLVAVVCQTSFKTNVSFNELLKDTLCFKPERIILGEMRGIEARRLLDSFNTGYVGSLATIHANSAEKAPPTLRQFGHA